MRSKNPEYMDEIIAYVDRFYSQIHEYPTCSQIAENTSLQRTAVFNYLVAMHKEGKIEYTFDHAAKLVKSESVRPPAAPETVTFPLDGKTMDLLSLLQHVRFLDLGEGKSESLHLLISGRSVSATLTCEGADPEKFPDKSVLRFRLKMVERGLMENGSGKEIVVWRSTAADRRILALEAALSAGSMTVSILE